MIHPIEVSDLTRMRGQLLFDGEDRARKLSRFWALLVMASVIAAAGIVADSTATVIGAMIVAPLMTPILGTCLSVATEDRRNLLRSLGLVVTGAVAVIAIGWLFGRCVRVDVIAGTNSQVAGRVHPGLIDLVAALATGAVGSFAAVRSDVSDTLPGVAIAISLVPPLAVVGLTLEAGATGQSVGALLLFLTNVGAILLSGLIVMALYRVQRAAAAAGIGGGHRRIGTATVVAFVLVLCVPLAVSTARMTADTLDRTSVKPVADAWAASAGWRVVRVDSSEEGIEVDVAGGLPAPDPQLLRRRLDDAGLGGVHVIVSLIPSERVDLPGT